MNVEHTDLCMPATSIFVSDTVWLCPLKYNLSGSYIAANMQVHHGGAGTTAAGLKAGVIFSLASIFNSVDYML